MGVRNRKGERDGNEKFRSSKKHCVYAVAILAVAAIATLGAEADPKPQAEPAVEAQNDRVPLNAAAAQVSAKTSTGGGVNHGITYTITINAALPVMVSGAILTKVSGSVSFVLVKAVAPTFADGTFTVPLNLDEDASGMISTQLTITASTSFGLRGQGEMPTMLHPRVELFFEDKKGDYGSAILIKQLEPVAFVSEGLSMSGDGKQTSVVVAYDFKETP